MLRAALTVLLLSAAPLWAQGSPISVEGAYAIAPRPGATTGSAYMEIRNAGAAPDRLVGVSSPAAARVMLHTSTETRGVMRMADAPDGLEVPAGGTLLLERGGAHVMFMGIAPAWTDGQTVPVTLTFETAGPVTVEVPVDQSRLTGAPDGMDMDDGMDMGHAAHGTGQGG